MLVLGLGEISQAAAGHKLTRCGVKVDGWDQAWNSFAT
jgi:hypothetical protein